MYSSEPTSTMMRTKALLIGIQYADSREYTEADGPQFAGKEKWDDLDGPHHDVARMKHFLDHGPWQYGQTRMLLDKEGFMRPNRQNIIDALHWLIEGATEEHRLFLHYSGHGSQAWTDSLSEMDHYDETIVPVDCPPADTDEGIEGMIRDNDLREILVDGLPVGCNLTALFDCCHSGSILDLRYCYPRYLSMPYAWQCAGPASDHPRLNRLPSEQTTKSNTLPPHFNDTIPPDLEVLRTPVTPFTPPIANEYQNTNQYQNTPTLVNPRGLPDPVAFHAPLPKTSYFSSILETPMTEVTGLLRKVSLGERRLSRKSFHRRKSTLSQGLAFSTAPVLAYATDSFQFGSVQDGHSRKGSGESERKKRKPSIAMGLRAIQPTTTLVNNLSSGSSPPLGLELGIGPLRRPAVNVETWRQSVSSGSTIHGQQFFEEAYLCEEQTLSPTSTISALPMRHSFQLQRSSVIQGMITQALRSGEQNACYEDPSIPSPFQTLQYARPIKSRATFGGFHKPPAEAKPAPRVSSFSACYDDQAVFETCNGDGLLTSAFIQCMTDNNHEVTYGEMMAEMKKFFVRTHAERDPEDQFTIPPFPMLSSSYPMDLQAPVEI